MVEYTSARYLVDGFDALCILEASPGYNFRLVARYIIPRIK